VPQRLAPLFLETQHPCRSTISSFLSWGEHAAREPAELADALSPSPRPLDTLSVLKPPALVAFSFNGVTGGPGAAGTQITGTMASVGSRSSGGALLVRIARQTDLQEGAKIVRVSGGPRAVGTQL